MAPEKLSILHRFKPLAQLPRRSGALTARCARVRAGRNLSFLSCPTSGSMQLQRLQQQQRGPARWGTSAAPPALFISAANDALMRSGTSAVSIRSPAPRGAALILRPELCSPPAAARGIAGRLLSLCRCCDVMATEWIEMIPVINTSSSYTCRYMLISQS